MVFSWALLLLILGRMRGCSDSLRKLSLVWDDVAVETILCGSPLWVPLMIAGAGLVIWLLVKRLLDFRDALPFLWMATWTALVLVMPVNHYGNLDEFHHRPFHVVYYIFIIWLAGRSINLFLKRVDQRKLQSTIPGPKLKLALISLSALLLIVPWHFGKGVLNIGPCANRHQNFN